MLITPHDTPTPESGMRSGSDIEGVPESAWIEVIRKMESVYTDLVNTQTEIEQKNAALENAHQFIRSVLSAMTDVLIVCDLEGRIEKVNDAVRTLTGIDEDDLLGTDVLALFAADSRQAISDGLTSNDVEAHQDQNVALMARGNEPFLLAVNCSNRYNANGKLVGKVLIGRSIGELHRAYQDLATAHESLQRAQNQLVQSEKMASLGRLVAGVAHELNNPISFVFGNMSALRSYEKRLTEFLSALDSGASMEDIRELRATLKIDRIMGDMDSLIEGSLEGAERVSDIVQSLRRYSTPQRESVSTFDLADAIRTAVRWVSKGTRHPVAVDYAMPDDLSVVGHKGTVHQILMNLVQNAADVMEDLDEPRLSIDVTKGAADVSIRVRDFGPGIDDDELPKLFEPFYTTKPVGKGTGLGLSISYGLAVNQGGDLTVENDPDGGAAFTLRLPLEFQDAND